MSGVECKVRRRMRTRRIAIPGYVGGHKETYNIFRKPQGLLYSAKKMSDYTCTEVHSLQLFK